MDSFAALKNELGSISPETELRENEPMSAHTTFRIGGGARLMAFPKTEEQAACCIRCAEKSGVRWLVLGNGSNILAPDGGLDAFVIKTEGLCGIRIDGNTVEAGAGALLSKTAYAAMEGSLTGMEFAHGIPGTVGGAFYMNAGAYGGEIKDIALSARCLKADGSIVELSSEEMGFGYRKSVFEAGELFILSVKLRLAEGDRAAIKAAMDTLSQKRRGSQPLDMPSAGSTFKRPEKGYAAALIDECGLKGLRIGGAMVSEKHAGFVVNAGGATCEDVLSLMEQVKNEVKNRTGVVLEPEVRILR